ncbi:hypothetical protein ACVWW1_009003 [Bradyrhizobium sp. JR3.5]
MADRETRRSIIFSCPNTRDWVKRLLRDTSELHPITCVACDAGHFIGLRIGAMLGPSAASPSE